MVDNTLMEKRIRPWVHKKIAEYIGEPEPTLTDFICSKVLLLFLLLLEFCSYLNF